MLQDNSRKKQFRKENSSQEENFSSIERCEHDAAHHFVIISKALIRDHSISPRCRWFIMYCLSFGAKWKISIPFFIKETGISKDIIYSMIKEAIGAGYLHRSEYLNKGLKTYRYIVSESAKFKKCLPCLENPDTEKPDTTYKELSSYEDRHINERKGGMGENVDAQLTFRTTPLTSFSSDFQKMEKVESYEQPALKMQHNINYETGFETNKTKTQTSEINNIKNIKKEKDPKILFGDHVWLSMQEYEKLCSAIGKEKVDLYIEEINDYIPNSKPKKDYAAFIRNWHRKALKFESSKRSTTSGSFSKSTSVDVRRNKNICEFVEKKLDNASLCNSYVYFNALGDHAIMYHKDKDINIRYNYSEFEGDVLKKKLLNDLQMCFPRAKDIFAEKQQSASNAMINGLANKMRLQNA